MRNSEFTSGSDYRAHLLSLGYTDLGWQNGWNQTKDDEWAELRKDQTVEDYQWNRSGSDCTYTIHSKKVFCSVDMGD